MPVEKAISTSATFIVTSAYTPLVRCGVHAKNGREIRYEGLAAVSKKVDHVNNVRYGCHHIIAAHVNAIDG